MNALASTLPEYEVVMGMYGVGKTYGPQRLFLKQPCLAALRHDFISHCNQYDIYD